ncbi:MAG: ABC transporter permease, partial [Hyphomicrobiaceae bacterium]
MSPRADDSSPQRSPVAALAAHAGSWLRAWRKGLKSSPGWLAAVVLILAVVALPVLTTLWLALSPTDNIWPHLLATVLPASTWQTVQLILGAGTLTLVTGTAAAWLVTMYRFPGRATIDRLLVIPLAMPTYIVAYCYVELLDYSGPVQSAIRAIGGFQSSRDYWFPEIRSLGGAIFITSAVLYPYVYMTARASFVQQSVCALEVARTLGRTPLQVLTAVALPLARPALAAGVALVAMECLNDLGAVQYLGVQTLSQSIYATWLQQSNLGGAAQIASVLLMLVVALFVLESVARGHARVHHTTGRYRSIPFQDIVGWRGYAAAAVALAPFVIGFLLPFLQLARHAFVHGQKSLQLGFFPAAANSLMLSSITAITAVGLALVLAYARRVDPNPFTNSAIRIASLGYAIPGTVLALGLLIPLAGLDNAIDAFMRSTFGLSTGLLMSGTVAALVLAYTIRFL